MRDSLTLLLGALAVLLIAGGTGAALFEYIGWWAVMVAGVIVLAAAEVAEWRSKPKKADR